METGYFYQIRKLGSLNVLVDRGEGGRYSATVPGDARVAEGSSPDDAMDQFSHITEVLQESPREPL